MTRCKLLKKISCYWFSSFLSSHDSCRWPFIFSLESNHLISVIFRWNLELLVDGRALVMDQISTQKPGFCVLEVLWRNRFKVCIYKLNMGFLNFLPKIFSNFYSEWICTFWSSFFFNLPWNPILISNLLVQPEGIYLIQHYMCWRLQLLQFVLIHLADKQLVWKAKKSTVSSSSSAASSSENCKYKIISEVVRLMRIANDGFSKSLHC